MKLKLIAFFLCFSFTQLFAQENKAAIDVPDSTQETILAEASCGTCKLGMKGETCALAVRFNGASYFVDGAHIDSFGDAHGDDGFCNAIRKAKVQGKIVNNRFVATSFILLPEEPEKK